MRCLIINFFKFSLKKGKIMAYYLSSLGTFLGNITGLSAFFGSAQPASHPSSIELTDPWANNTKKIEEKSQKQTESPVSSSALILSSSIGSVSTSNATVVSATSISQGVLFSSIEKKLLEKIKRVYELLKAQSDVSTFQLRDGRKYSGKMENNKAHGEGSLVLPNGDIYIGAFSEGRKKGFGIYLFNKQKSYYEGMFEDDDFNGKGILLTKEKEDSFMGYEGNFENGNKSGRGKFTRERLIYDEIFVTEKKGIFGSDMFISGDLKERRITNESNNKTAENEPGFFDSCTIC
jgi:hypothetical protein